MEKLFFTILIDASREKVWNIMLSDKTYRQWTAPFHPGSYFVGNWQQGSEIRFLGPGNPGDEPSGMYSRIKESRLHEFVSIEHLGFIVNGIIDTTSAAAKNFSGALENYSLNERGQQTEILIEMDSIPEYREMFQSAWPKALGVLKSLAET
jgi:hypothetical protein